MTPVPAYSSRTIASYETEAEHYDTLIAAAPSAPVETALCALLANTEPGAQVLEIGSGSGRDADYLEAHGLRVHRTDATEAFIRLQAGRGKHVDPLNVISDPLGGPYDAVMALCVLIHVDRADTGRVLDKIATALRPGGSWLISLREGTGELTDDEYHMTYWQREEFVAHLAAAGLIVEWEYRHTGRHDQTWLTFLGKTASQPDRSA
jgi:2-polyprenyl-3-methyl-5-hydroxy-6-metoxy-1,4-benzoquinol methylase